MKYFTNRDANEVFLNGNLHIETIEEHVLLKNAVRCYAQLQDHSQETKERLQSMLRAFENRKEIASKSYNDGLSIRRILLSVLKGERIEVGIKGMRGFKIEGSLVEKNENRIVLTENGVLTDLLIDDLESLTIKKESP